MVNTVPPTIATANGGQKPPPAMINGIKPPTVVIVVELICRVHDITASTTASTNGNYI